MFARCFKSSGKRYIITETNIYDLSMFLDFFLLGFRIFQSGSGSRSVSSGSGYVSGSLTVLIKTIKVV